MISAHCKKDNTLLMSTKDHFKMLKINEQGKFVSFLDMSTEFDSDIITAFVYDEITGKIYFTTKDLKIKCLSKDFTKISEICLCRDSNIQFVGGYNSLFYFDIKGSVSSLNIISLMPNRIKYSVNAPNRQYEATDFLVIPQIDRLYVLSKCGTVFIFIISNGKRAGFYDFSTSRGKKNRVNCV